MARWGLTKTVLPKISLVTLTLWFAVCYQRPTLAQAAEAGCSDAVHLQGCVYQRGWGLPADFAEAVFWYRKAAEQGHKEAQQALDEMMTESGIDGQSTTRP